MPVCFCRMHSAQGTQELVVVFIRSLAIAADHVESSETVIFLA